MFSIRPLAVTTVAVVLSACAPADGVESVQSAEVVAATAGLQLQDLEKVVSTLHEKFTSLAEAIPEDDLGWQPMEGVRSVEDVFIHVAADNWYVPALMGWDAPDETDVTDDVMTFRAYQERDMSRAEMLSALDASFEFFRAAMRESAGDTDREVVLGTPTTVGDVWIRAVVHLHEHLGQTIAYARTNEVVPPWSR